MQPLTPWSISMLGELLLLIVSVGGWLILPFSVRLQIALYQMVSVALALSAVATALAVTQPWPALLALPPLGFALFAWPLMRFVSLHVGSGLPQEPIAASGRAPRGPQLAVLVGITAVMAGATLALALRLSTMASLPLALRNGHVLAAFALLGAGWSCWALRRNLLAQVVGLLVMDDSLFVLTEALVGHQQMVATGLLVCALYLTVPLAFFLVVLPRLHDGFNASEYAELRG